MIRTLLVVMTAALLVVAVRAGTDPAARCTAAKLKAAAKRSGGEMRCRAAAAALQADVDAGCLARAAQKFQVDWARAEAGGGCATNGDESAIAAKIEACAADVASSLSPCGEVGGVCGGGCPQGLSCFAIGVGCRGEPEPCRCHGSTTTCPSTTTTTSSTVPAPVCGEVNGVCGGNCPSPLSCFAIGVGCYGEPEPCRCHGSTTTCPPTTTTSSTLP